LSRSGRRIVAVAPVARGGGRRQQQPDSCGVYPEWPELPSISDAEVDPVAVMRTLTSQLLSVPTPVMGQALAYDFLANGEVSTGLVEWREAAWAWRNFAASQILAPYDELDAAARRSAAQDGSCQVAASTQPVESMRATLGAIARMLDGARARYPKLAAVLKFIPKKNGLNPLLAQLASGDTDLGLDSMQPREFEHLNRDVRRSFNQ
jgi:hypothetical protein